MKRIKIPFILSITLLSACVNDHNETSKSFDFTINFDKVNEVNTNCKNYSVEFNKKQDCLLSTVASDIKYIKLDSESNSIIGTIAKVFISNNYIITFDISTQSVFIFDNSGKIINKICKKGNGPYEFVKIWDVDVDFERKLIYICDEQRKIVSYFFDGSNNNYFPVKYPVFTINLLNNKNLLLFTPTIFFSNNKEDFYNLLVVNDSGKTVNKIRTGKHEKRAANTFMISIGQSYKFNDMTYYLLPFNDTIYKCYNDTVNKHAVINYGKYKFRKELYENFDMYSKEKMNFIRMGLFNENNDYLFLTFDYLNENHKIVISKKGNSTILANENGFINDINGGLPIWPIFISNKYMVCVFEAQDLKDSYLRDQNNENFNADKRKEFYKLTQNINENDNPIIAIITLK